MSAGEILTLIGGAAWYAGGLYVLARIRRADDAARVARGEL